MNLQAILDQFTDPNKTGSIADAFGNKLGQIKETIPGGLAGGAIAGGVLGLLMSNRSARKFAGGAASYGGAALLGGLAYKAYQNWQHGQSNQTQVSRSNVNSSDMLAPAYQMTLIKAMIAAARADGRIDDDEQLHIDNAIAEMQLSTETKGVIFDLLRQPISVDEIAESAVSMEQKAEVYLVSCLVADADNTADQAHLDALAHALELPHGLDEELQQQARQNMADS